MVVGRRIYTCHQGVDKHKHDKQKRQQQLVDDHSDHCYKERRHLLQVSKKLDCPARIYLVHIIRFPDYKIPDDIHKQRKESAGRLRHALATNPSAVKFEKQYVACFPGIEEHKNHPVVGEAAEIREPVDTRVEKHIEKLALAGARKVSEVRRHISIFVAELFRGEAPPPPTRRRFYPLDKDIRNIIKATNDSKRQSSIDQVNLQGLVDNWTKYHDCLIKYRPSQEDDDETTADVREALAVFREWNPDWKPSHFMVDFSEVEIGALEAVFHESKVLLCDFHREKAWVEWTRKKDNGCHEEVLPLLRSIADSPTEEEFACRLFLLQQSKAWQENEKLRRWFSNKWLPQTKRWVRVFRGESLRVAIYTNNGVERQNETLKHTYLEGYKNCSLSEMLTVIVTGFLPRTYQKYIELNVKCSSGYRKYSERLPLFLRDRPRVVVDHIMDRHLQAMSYQREDVIMHGDGAFSVKSQTADYYKIYFGSHTTMPSCTCEDWQRNLLPCKHFCAVFSMVQGWGWEKLGVMYRDNPLFSLDVICLTSSITPRDSSPPPRDSSPPPRDSSPPPRDSSPPPRDSSPPPRDSSPPPRDSSPPPRDSSPPPRDSSPPPRDSSPPTQDDTSSSVPPKGNSKTKKRQKCGSLLREISDLTYHLQDEPFLDSLTVRLNDLLEDVRRHTPHDDTLPLSYTPPSKKYRSLKPLSMIPRKHPFSGRFGRRAEARKASFNI
ncbi:uncharacterized protein [Garra rufa]|uniref:uncharacterized protein n=1 Tax=Garra rufa TaxID=137080 RepID=UPI003CCED799